ncbi:hypothetical protein ACFT7S_34415 [Streptomyces sp. NPDC057136]|uniref:hypothetical protein n=1 Tax=Streptomyces sp. NPDC057136 TaxID=3346029 RepID=UPI00362B9D41
MNEESDSFLRMYDGSGPRRPTPTIWSIICGGVCGEGLRPEVVTLLDLHRYMGAMGSKVQMPFGQPWRMPPKRPYGTSAISCLAACLKGFCGAGTPA